MAACLYSVDCVFHRTVEPSIAKRIRYASSFVFCRGGREEECAIRGLLSRGATVPGNLMPDGTTGDYLPDATVAIRPRFLVIEDSPVFAALAASTLSRHFSGAEIVRHATFGAAEPDLRAGDHSAIVCGYGLGEGKTVHHVRELSSAPIVVLTGRPDQLQLPHRSRMVAKSAGPDALAAALRSILV